MNYLINNILTIIKMFRHNNLLDSDWFDINNSSFYNNIEY